MNTKNNNAGINRLLKNIMEFKCYIYKMKKRFFLCVFLLAKTLTFFSQDISIPEGLNSDYIFTSSSIGDPQIITKTGTFGFKNKFVFHGYESIKDEKKSQENLKTLNNQNYKALIDSLNTVLVLSGGGHVYSHSKQGLKRLDKSVEQQNQFDAAVFIYNKNIYMYGGYGFWSFKDYLTVFDKSTGQWEIMYLNSDYIPKGRWKPVYQILNDKLYVLGGRNNSEESGDMDTQLNDHFYFDFKTKTFENQGEINDDFPLQNSYNSNVVIENKLAFLLNDQLVSFDFEKDSVYSYFEKNLFQGIDTKRPVVYRLDTLYYIKNINNKTFLAKFPVKKLSTIKPKIMAISKAKTSNFLIALATFLVIIISWVSFKLFTYKDFLKGLVLFDEKRIYCNQNSEIISNNQLRLIQHLVKKNSISSDELNKILSSKKYVKSHFTLLRTDFIKEINKSYKNVTISESDLIEEVKDPSDKRYKVYKITKQIFKKESFFTYLFKL